MTSPLKIEKSSLLLRNRYITDIRTYLKSVRFKHIFDFNERLVAEMSEFQQIAFTQLDDFRKIVELDDSLKEMNYFEITDAVDNQLSAAYEALNPQQ